MSPAQIDRPVFVVGAPRSGTTLVFKAFAARPDLAWFSEHLGMLPRWPSVTVLARLADLSPVFRKSIARSDRRSRAWEKLRVGPSEAYEVWREYCGERFLFNFLLDEPATDVQRRELRELVVKLLRYQGKPRFATKLTGPARIAFLSSVFPDARFVHVIRDPRAVALSLLDVPFWRDTWRARSVAWEGGVTSDELDLWRSSGATQAGLAAVQWRAIIRSARAEARRFAPGRYAELRYEGFISEPHASLRQMTEFCELPQSPEAEDFLSSRVELSDMNVRWRQVFDDNEIEVLRTLIGDELREMGYERQGLKHPMPTFSIPFVAESKR